MTLYLIFAKMYALPKHDALSNIICPQILPIDVKLMRNRECAPLSTMCVYEYIYSGESIGQCVINEEELCTIHLYMYIPKYTQSIGQCIIKARLRSSLIYSSPPAQ